MSQQPFSVGETKTADAKGPERGLGEREKGTVRGEKPESTSAALENGRAIEEVIRAGKKPDPEATPIDRTAQTALENGRQVEQALRPDTAVEENRGDAALSRVLTINGERVINSEYAGRNYPPEKLTPDAREIAPDGVPFKENGCPDFSKFARKKVEIEMTGERYEDFKKANLAAGLDRTPQGYTWHHCEDCKTMQLVPSDLHSAVKHTGGVSILKALKEGIEVRGDR